MSKREEALGKSVVRAEYWENERFAEDLLDHFVDFCHRSYMFISIELAWLITHHISAHYHHSCDIV